MTKLIKGYYVSDIAEPVLTDSIFAKVKSAAAVGTVRERARLLKLVQTDQELLAFVLAVGCLRLLKAASARHKHGKNGVVSRKNRCVISSLVTHAKARALGRIVEMLDLKKVGNKNLGDCTRPDLLRQAANLDVEASDMRIDAELYRTIAKMLPDNNTTVRQAQNKKQIIALLTTTYKEDL